MAILKNEPFDSGTVGATLTTANTTFGYVGGSPTFTETSKHGARAMSIVVGSTAEPCYGQLWLDSTVGTGYLRFYVKLNAAPPVFYLAQMFAGSTQVATLSVQSDRGLRMRQGSSVTIGDTSSSFKLTVGEWVRVEWCVSPTTMQLRVFSGANIEGATPSYDSGAIAWTAGTFNRVGLGSTASVASVSASVDEFAVGTDWIGSVAPQEPPATVYPAFRYTGSVWNPCEIITI